MVPGQGVNLRCTEMLSQGAVNKRRTEQENRESEQ
jgi:hypothetical protein